MAEPLKNVYSPDFIDQLLTCWNPLFPEINQEKVKAFIFSEGWESFELKQRMNRLSDAMIMMLPSQFEDAVPLVYQMIDQLEKNDFPKQTFEYMFIPEWVEKTGRSYPDQALPLLARITQFVSAEFAIRPFIINKPEHIMKTMLEWSKHNDKNIRRLSSEGCRPRLPWAMAIPEFKKDPSTILPVLENLKNDESLYVRKSVANNLNDISKDHPELVLKIASQWYNRNKNTDWVVKHALRTLLKAGHPTAMKLFGYTNIQNLNFHHFQVLTQEVNFGNELQFQFSLINTSSEEAKVRLEYAVYFLKQNGSHTKKVFKISERNLLPKQELHILKAHKIKAISTRKYYPGKHLLSVIINGIEQEKQHFLLNM